MILVLSPPMATYIELLEYIIYPFASDIVVQLTAILVDVVSTSDKVGADDGAKYEEYYMVYILQYAYEYIPCMILLFVKVPPLTFQLQCTVMSTPVKSVTVSSLIIMYVKFCKNCCVVLYIVEPIVKFSESGSALV